MERKITYNLKKRKDFIMAHYYANSYYGDSQYMYVDERLDFCQAGIKRDGDIEYLYSYTTPVIKVDKALRTLCCSGLYSNTTIKHIVRYLKRYNFLNYYDIKKLVQLREKTGDLWVIENCFSPSWYYKNLNTGEIWYTDEIKITPKKVQFIGRWER